MSTSSTSTALTDLPAYCQELGVAARQAALSMTQVSGAVRNDVLRHIADALENATDTLIVANVKDLDAAPGYGLTPAMVDRLRIDAAGVANMASAVRQIAAQPDPVGKVLEGRVLPNGIRLEKVRVPMGTVLIIFESRPNVTCDAAALCLKSGNAVILRGGKEALHSNAAIAACVAQGLTQGGLDPAAVQLVATTDRAAVGELLKLDTLIDVCIPRGGESLIRAVVEQSRIPVIKHYTGNCHVYVDSAADVEVAVNVVVNAKTHRTGVCNAAETILLHQDTIESGLAERIGTALSAKGVALRADTRSMAVMPGATPATDADWSTEYLDLIAAVRVVDSLDDAVAHINRYGSKHTDAILTQDIAAADRFVQSVDTANVMVNCSTRFSDGQQYGLGAEIGISTDKLHARGPMGAEDLTTYKWVCYGSGQVRQ
ncbi:MAG: glutamate-5-semialdehyde dehydrogenase [Algisphaera sp.]